MLSVPRFAKNSENRGTLQHTNTHLFFDNIVMALRTILLYPHPKLHTVANAVATVDDHIRQLTQDMLETMYNANGIGLAATQIDVHQRVIVIDVSETRDQPIVLINPEIQWLSDTHTSHDEGCLSIPGIYETIERPEQVHVRAVDAQGNSRTIEADGILAICIQHEIDHLDGKLFVDYLSPLKRERIKTKMQKLQREAARNPKDDTHA